MFQTYSRHRITSDQEMSFDPVEYSKFKFGDFSLAQTFGRELFEGFMSRHRELLERHEEIVLIPSPYHYIPTASYFLTRAFGDLVNEFLYTRNKASLLLSKIHRNKTYSVDYGNLSFDERLNLIQSDTYHLDTGFLSGKLCLFIDDVKITGSHELIIRKLLTNHGLQGPNVFLYFAELATDRLEPSFENFLNYAFVNSLDEVAYLINYSNFEYNTRVIKYILGSKKEDLLSFINSVPETKLSELVPLAIGNNYHIMEEYASNLRYIIGSLKQSERLLEVHM